MNIILSFFALLLMPFELLLASVFSFAYLLTGNYGISLILMSLFITAIIAPLYYLAEKWKNEEKVVQNKMALDIHDIKESYTGQKRFYLIRAAYRIYGYKSRYAFKTSFGLLIQIPFFFAAYSVLSHYEGYAGISFLFIKDLAKPDGLLFGLNLLPFVMSIINLIAAFYYTRTLKLKENRDLIIITLVFLVLLYNSPAALLIYWTMNNVFSLFKNIILRQTGVQKPPILSVDIPEKKDSLILKVLKEEPNLLPHFFLILSFSLLVYGVVNWNTTNAAVTFGYTIIVAIAFVITISSTVFSLYKFRISSRTMILIFLWILFFAVFFLKNIGNHEFIISRENRRVLIAFLFILLIFYPLFSGKKIIKDIIIPGRGVIFLIVFTTLFFLLFYQPLIYYLSSPEDIDLSLQSLLLVLITVSMAPLIISLILIFLLPKNGKYFLLRFILFFLMCSFVYSIILRLDTGFLDIARFQNEGAIFAMPVTKHLMDPFIIIGLWILSGYLFIKKPDIVKICCLVFIVTMLFTIGDRIIKADLRALLFKQRADDGGSLPESAYKNHVFSKDGKNIVLVLADTFNGNYFGRLLNEDAKYSEMFSGFSYYPDCLSISSQTVASMPGIFGGHNYIPVKLNNNGKTGHEEIQEAGNKFFLNISNSNYNITVVKPFGIQTEKLPVTNVDERDYLNYYKKESGYEGDVQIKTAALFMLSLFNAVPYHLKYSIYDRANWTIFRTFFQFQTVRANTVQRLAYIELLPKISSASGKENKFFYIHNDLPHRTYGIDAEGNLIKAKSPDTDNSTGAYYSAKKFIDIMGNWINWMKKNNVYDNTMILIFSDHGNNYEDHDIKLPEHLNKKQNFKEISCAQTLLLVKGFGKKGKVKIDPVGLSSADIPAILTGETGILFSSDKDPRNAAGTRKLIYTYVSAGDFVSKNFSKFRSYEVKGSMFNPGSWNISDEKK